MRFSIGETAADFFEKEFSIEKELLKINKLEHVLMRHRIYPMSKYRKSRSTFSEHALIAGLNGLVSNEIAPGVIGRLILHDASAIAGAIEG